MVERAVQASSLAMMNDTGQALIGQSHHCTALFSPLHFLDSAAVGRRWLDDTSCGLNDASDHAIATQLKQSISTAMRIPLRRSIETIDAPHLGEHDADPMHTQSLCLVCLHSLWAADCFRRVASAESKA